MNRLPDVDEPIVGEGGIANEQARLYWLQLGDLLLGNIGLIMKEYTDLSDLTDSIPKPNNRQIAGIVTGQGLAINNNGTWVLAADDTTAIT